VSYRSYSAPQPLLIGYDPFRDLPPDHLARLVDQVVDETVKPPKRAAGAGQPAFDPRLCLKVLVYGYATGMRSSRRLEQACRENLAFLYLTRGDTPSYGTLCTVRTEQGEFLEDVWQGLFAVAAAVGLERVGRIVIDSTKLRADVSPEAVLQRREFEAVRAELERIVAEAARTDAREETAASPAATRGKVVPREQMRDILRRVRKEQHAFRKGAPAAPAVGGNSRPADPPGGAGAPAALPLEDWPPAGGIPAPAAAAPEGMTPKMLQRVQHAITALNEALADGRQHVALTDPDARMMAGGRDHRVEECHSWEIAVDAGLLVAAGTTQEPTDNARLLPLVAAAERWEPAGILAVDADSGYYRGDDVAGLATRGIDTCIPDSNTAGDLHRGRPIGTTRAASRGRVPFAYDAAADVFRCPEGNTLVPTQKRQQCAQKVTMYRTERPCTDCPRQGECLTRAGAKHRTLMIAENKEVLDELRARFGQPEHVERYHRRGDAVETVFGFLRGVLGYRRWLLRGAEKVACEGSLFAAA
jgi:transposase